MGLDRQLFYAINGWPDSWSPFFFVLSELTKLPAARVALVALVIGLVIYKPTRVATALANVSWLLANETCDQFKAFGKGLRPNVELPDVHVRVAHLTSFGTASAHSANMAALATAFWLRLGWKWGLPWAILAFLTGLSRIYNGVHYPSQVLLGWGVGCIVAFLIVRLYEGWVRSRNVEPASGS